MTEQEVITVMVAMNAAWPSFEITDSTVALWAREMHDLDAQDAEVATHMLIRNAERFPSVSQFRATTLGITRRSRDHERQTTRALPSGEARLTVDEAKHRISAIRDTFDIPQGIYKPRHDR